jgi:hypothetical protein
MTDPDPDHFSLLITAFYTTYIAFQPLSHLYHLVPAHIHLTLSVISVLLTSHLSDRYSTRCIPLLLHSGLCFLGFTDMTVRLTVKTRRVGQPHL